MEMIDNVDPLKNKLAKEMAGEIVFSSDAGNILKKWRSVFKVSQKDLAQRLDVTSSVICDYESGRRKSPGIGVIRKYIDALLGLDESKGGETIKSLTKGFQLESANKSILDIKEFFSGLDTADFCKMINADLIVEGEKKDIFGYTIIDSVRAISELSGQELIKIYGIATQRALFFTGVTTGKTPMVAVKLSNLKPGLVVLHGLENVDPLALKIAQKEGISLALCREEKIEDVIEKLKRVE